MMDKWGWILCLGIVLYRIGILLLLRSTYHPDEYYQYQEPATWLAHSLDAKDTIDHYLTWEWQFPYRIRSFSSLLTCTIGYRILHILNVKWPFVYTIWPRALHCFWTIIGDIALFSINKSIHISMDSKMSTEIATYAVCFHLFSGFLTYCCCRSLSNLTEMNSWIISLALFQQLFSGKLTDRTTRRIVLAFLALLCVQTVYLRPSSLLLWMPIMAPWLWMQSHQCWREDEKFWFIRVSIWIAVVGILLDSALYQELTLAPWRFITMNVGQNIAQVFGTTLWHWPLSEGIPVNTGLYCLLVPDMLMNWRSLRTSTPIFLRVWLLASLLFAVGLRIVTSHQEHRFLLPILPAVHSLLALAVVQYKQSSIGKAFFSSRWLDIMRRWMYVLVPLLFAAQLVGAIFLLQYHQV
jgi:phosphatidylinositol glycan class B